MLVIILADEQRHEVFRRRFGDELPGSWVAEDQDHLQTVMLASTWAGGCGASLRSRSPKAWDTAPPLCLSSGWRMVVLLGRRFRQDHCILRNNGLGYDLSWYFSSPAALQKSLRFSEFWACSPWYRRKGLSLSLPSSSLLNRGHVWRTSRIPKAAVVKGRLNPGHIRY